MEDGTYYNTWWSFLFCTTTTLHCVIYWNSADLTLRFGDAGLGLTPHGPVQNGSVWRFIRKFRQLHIF